MKYRHLIALIFLKCLTLFYCYANEQYQTTDTTRTIIIELCKKAEDKLFENDSLCSKYLEQIKILQNTIKDYQPSDYLWEELATIYQGIGEYDATLRILEKVVDLSTVENDSASLGIALTRIARAYVRTSSWSKSLKYHLQALEINKQVNNVLAALNLNGIALVYRKRGKAEEAISMFKQAVLINQKYEANQGLFWNYINLANAFMTLEKYDSAVKYGKQAKALGDQENNEKMIADASGMLGEIYLDLGDLDRAEEQLEKLLKYPVSENPKNMIYTRFLLAQVWNKKGQIYKSIDLAEETLLLTKLYNTVSYDMFTHGLLGENYHLINDDRRAYMHISKYAQLKDSIYIERNQRERLALEEEYESKRRLEQIAFLEQKNELAQAKTQVASLTRNIIIIVALLVIAILIVVYHRYSTNRKQLATISSQKSKIEEHVKEKDLLMSELQHRTKNNLIMIRSLLKNQARRAKNPETKIIFNESTFQINAVTLVHEQLNLSEGFKSINCRQYFNQLIALYKKVNIHNEGIFFDTYIDDIDLSVHLLVPLGLIANEAITNSIKHAFKEETQSQPKITVKLVKQPDKKLAFEVLDNGRWTNGHKRGQGLGLIEGLGKQLNAEVSFDKTDGTKLSICFQEEFLEAEFA